MVKLSAIFLFLFLLIPTPILAESGEKIVTGKVVDIDWLGRKLTIRHVGYRTGRPDHITFTVPKDAELNRGSRKMSFLDMKQSDMVTVTYYSDDLGGLKVRHLENLNLGNR